MKGLIFSVKRYSIHDGPGIRVTFFMKGCPLSCSWCHNPEGISPLPEAINLSNRVGNFEFSKPGEVGKFYSTDEILEIAGRERVFMNHSNGGVTFSGGEPLVQNEFLLEALKLLKNNGYHTAVDTSGYSNIENIKQIIPFTDLFLFDLKHLNDQRHIASTGVSNALILDNYRFLLENARAVNVRIPVIPGFNNDPVLMSEMCDYLLATKTETLKKINLLPYHKIGSSKYRRFNMPYKMAGIEPPAKEEMLFLKETFLRVGVKVKIGG
jgi:pyruvate formate lyase activating enzyme